VDPRPKLPFYAHNVLNYKNTFTKPMGWIGAYRATLPLENVILNQTSIGFSLGPAWAPSYSSGPPPDDRRVAIVLTFGAT
jgi:hypothetical protein